MQKTSCATTAADLCNKRGGQQRHCDVSEIFYRDTGTEYEEGWNGAAVIDDLNLFLSHAGMFARRPQKPQPGEVVVNGR